VRLVELSTRRRVTVAMATVTLVLFGLIALADLKVNLLPDLSYPTLTVRTELTGAAPAEIENLLTQPVEEALGVVANVRKVRSVSRAGQSDVILEFAWGTDMDRASLDVRDRLEVLALPLDARRPVLLRFDPSTDPIIRLGLTGTADATGPAAEAELKQLRRFADEDLKRRLEPVPGVAAVKVGGGLEDEIQVEIDQQRLAQLNLDVGEVIARLRAENVNVSGGRIEEGSQRFLVRTINQFASVDEIGAMLVRVGGQTPIRLRDVATIRQGHRERESIIRIDGREAVELAIYKEGDANTVAVADAVKGRLAEVERNLPPGATLVTVDDQSVFIRQSIREVRNAAIEGGTLAILVIFFFLRHAWSTFIISLTLPISLIATFFVMGQLGLTLNVMSLGGLALATGLVVDDAIVVLESIAKKREQGLGVIGAVIAGASEVAMAVTASTLTTVAVFLPLVFVEGVAGQLFRDQAITVSAALLISLLAAMTLIPTLASLGEPSPRRFAEERDDPPAVVPALPRHPLARRVVAGWRAAGRFLFTTLPGALARGVRWSWERVGGAVGRALRRVGEVVMVPYHRGVAWYQRNLPNALERPGLVLGSAAVAFVGAMALVPLLGLDLIPQFQQGRFDVTLRLPPGTPLVDTDRVVAAIQREQAGRDAIATIYGVSGTGTRLDANPTESGENVGRLLVRLEPGAGARGERRAMDALRAAVAERPGVEVEFSRPQLFSFATPLEIEIRGYDLAALERAGHEMKRRLEASDRFVDVQSTVERGYPEIQIRFDQERAAALGLTTREIADQVVRKVRGEVATRYSFRDRKIDVLVRAREPDRASIDDIRNLIVNPGASQPVRLSSVAEVIPTVGPSEIHRVDQERVALVSADLAYGDLGAAVAEVERMLAGRPLAAGVDVVIGGQSEELDASVRSLVFALSLAVFLVYLVMASQFESLLHPFVILFTVPLAMVGAVLALFVTGTPLSVVVFIGLILLVGIVVKNAIVLIDKVNRLRGEGVPKREAIYRGAESRLRPIAMTSLCTIFGFLPLAVGAGEGAEVRAPMAIAVIGGLVVSTLLTLFVIPVMYDRLDRRPDAHYRERALRAERSLEAPAAGAA
jgi:HAE1 family hydrophobic/amphiphilic exporter-1